VSGAFRNKDGYKRSLKKIRKKMVKELMPKKEDKKEGDLSLFSDDSSDS
jgi:hypothetical protein